MDEYWKKSGQIPVFGNWDYSNELPITQYFDTARQAGLFRYSSSSDETDSYLHGEHDLYTIDFKKPVRKPIRNRERRYINVIFNDKQTTMNMNMNMRKHGKVYDVTEYPKKQTMNKNKNKVLHANDVVRGGHHQLTSKQHPKPVDEDLYKISPELLRTTKRKKMFGFISKCLVPCA